MPWHSVWYFEEKVCLIIIQKLTQLQQQCLSPLDFWQCKGCRSARSRTVGTWLGRRAPGSRHPKPHPSTRLDRSVWWWWPSSSFCPREVANNEICGGNKFSLVGELMPTCNMEVLVQSQPKLKDNIYKDHWKSQFARATLHSQLKL